MSWRMSLLFKWLKSDFSRGNFGPLFIYDFPAPFRPDHCAPDVLISVIQLVIKAILGTFDIKPTETEYSDDDTNGKSISSAIAKVSYQE